MAFTEQNKADAYLFFVLAFNAAPGTVYGGQIVQAYESGMTTADIVAQYVTKDAFTAIYPTTQTNAEFAAALVANVSSSKTTAAVKTAAEADIVAALAAGWTKAQVITQILGNLANKTVADAEWGATVAQLNNKIAVAKALTEGSKALNTSDVDTLTGPLKNVTEDVSTVQDAINGAGPLSAKIEALAASKKAVADFAKALDLNADGVADNLDSTTVQGAVEANVSSKAGAVTVVVTGWAASKTAAQNAALVASAKATNDATVAAAKDDVTAKIADATAAGVTSANIAQYKALADSVKATAAAAVVTQAELDGALAKLDTLNGSTLTPAGDGSITGYVQLNSSNVLVVDPALTDATKKAAATAYISAFNADKTADSASATAVAAKDAFATQIGSAPAASPAVVGAKEQAILNVITAETAVTTAEKLNPAIDKALAAYTAALATQTDLKGLTDAITSAEKAFTDAGLALPVEASTDLVATAGDDTYLVGSADGSVAGFGVLGKDSIFVGKGYTLNATGDLTKGSDATLEVFFKTSGANTEVYVEKKAFASSATGTDDLVKITLTGVTADKLVLKDGFITVAA